VKQDAEASVIKERWSACDATGDAMKRLAGIIFRNFMAIRFDLNKAVVKHIFTEGC